MSRRLDAIAEALIKDLIARISPFQEGSEEFQYVVDHFMDSLSKSHNVCLATHKEINERVAGLSDKFAFHALIQEASDLKRYYELFMGNNSNGAELDAKVLVMKFLFEMSTSPTRVLTCAPLLKPSMEQHSENINWAEYLLEGIDKWSLNNESISDELSICSEQNEHSQSKSLHGFERENGIGAPGVGNDIVGNLVKDATKKSTLKLLGESREKLKSRVQHSWFNQTYLRELPSSIHPEATLALRWEEYLSEVTSGIWNPKFSIISEYKVIREIIWQFGTPHKSFVFDCKEDELSVKDEVTICSLRPMKFKSFVNLFIPMINTVNKLHAFCDLVRDDWVNSPGTYKGYTSCLREVLLEFQKNLGQFELEVMKQEKTQTLISTMNTVRNLFKEVLYVKNLHDQCVLDYKKHKSIDCAAYLLAKLQFHFETALDDMERVLSGSLLVASLCKYVSTIDVWFRRLKHLDPAQEFPVYWNNPRVQYATAKEVEELLSAENEYQQTEYFIRDVSVEILQRRNPIFHRIRENIGRIMRTVHLIMLFRRGFELVESDAPRLFAAFEERVLQNVQSLCSTNLVENLQETARDKWGKDSLVKWEKARYYTEMDKLGNFVDTDNELLLQYFSKFLQGVTEKPTVEKKKTFLQKLRLVVRNVMPVRFVIADSLFEVFNDRYLCADKLLLRILKEDYQIWQHFDFYQSLYLFKSTAIIPFCLMFFNYYEKYEKYPLFYLTQELQECLKQSHPQYWNRVGLKGAEDFCVRKTELGLYCLQFEIDYEPHWPFTIFMTSSNRQMYGEIFNLILHIKWCLYVLAHLEFTSKQKLPSSKIPPWARTLFRRMYEMRHILLDVFSTIHHFVFGYFHMKYVAQFRKDFENASNFDELKSSHDVFVHKVHRSFAQLRDFAVESDHSFTTAVYLVGKLHQMWYHPESIDDSKLVDLLEDARRCHQNLTEAVNELVLLSTFQ